jgi:hypothetical protein
MTKEPKNKRKRNSDLRPPTPDQPTAKKTLTPEEKARIIRDRLANRPIIVFRYPNGKLNKRFIIILALFVIAMIVAFYFLSRL